MDKRFVFSTISLIIFSCIAITVSLSSDYWVYKSSEEHTSYVGLFKGCMKTKTFTTKFCYSIEDPPIEMEVVKGLVIFGLVLSVASIIIVILKASGYVSGKNWLNGGAFMLIVAGLALIGGIVVYTLRIYEESWTLHVGFAFACIAVVTSFICAGLLKKMGPYIESEAENAAV